MSRDGGSKCINRLDIYSYPELGGPLVWALANHGRLGVSGPENLYKTKCILQLCLTKLKFCQVNICKNTSQSYMCDQGRSKRIFALQ